MSELRVYFAHAMDEIPASEVASTEEAYRELLTRIGATITNPYSRRVLDPLHEAFDVVQRDFDALKSSNVVLVDLSLPDYQYVGCVFEMVEATYHDIPVILVVGQSSLDNRVFVQAFSDFIARDAVDAVEFTRRAYTLDGIAEQMSEMKAYYSAVASTYTARSVKPRGDNANDLESFARERDELRAFLEKYARGEVCQLGIGTGDWTRTVCESAAHVLAVEQSSEMLAQARINLARYQNVSFLQCDAVEEEMVGGPFDCVVVYFLFSLLPPKVQDRLFIRISRLLKADGCLIVADTKRISDIPGLGLGRRKLQERFADGRRHMLYKEHFVGDCLAKLLKSHDYAVTDVSCDSVWFTWAASYKSI